MTAAAAVRAVHPYRMKDLSDRTGLPRQVIHFYIQQGLVPEGHKTGRNMAYYGDEHLARINLVRKLQHERFLPLKAIRAVLGAPVDAFSAGQRALLVDVKEHLTRTLFRTDGAAPAPGYVAAADVLLRTGVPLRDLEEMIQVGLVAAVREQSGKKVKTTLRIASGDVWIVENWAELRALGFTRALGFSPRDMGIYEEALAKVFDAETKMLTARLKALPPERVATMVERAIPLMNTFLVRYHDRKIRSFFASLAPAQEPKARGKKTRSDPTRSTP